jgi:hypothetical protein
VPSLANDQLRVEVLDPLASKALLGPRFCWGAYIWQVHDAVLGPLLTGPEWPAPAPLPFNGQGLPESFRHRTRDGRQLTWMNGRGVCLGAGGLALAPSGDVSVGTPCSWKIDASPGRLVFSTRQAVAGFSYALTRELTLTGRELVSRSVLINTAPQRLTLQWFPHPFFALSDDLVRAEVPADSTLKENPGFTLENGVLTQRKRFEDLKDGHMDLLQLPADRNFAVRLTHPKLTHIDFTTDYAPSECVIWANNVTFSIEPYLALNLAPGGRREWCLRYTFGPPSQVI